MRKGFDELAEPLLGPPTYGHGESQSVFDGTASPRPWAPPVSSWPVASAEYARVASAEYARPVDVCPAQRTGIRSRRRRALDRWRHGQNMAISSTSSARAAVSSTFAMLPTRRGASPIYRALNRVAPQSPFAHPSLPDRRKRLFAMSQPIRGTFVETYLRNRGYQGHPRCARTAVSSALLLSPGRRFADRRLPRRPAWVPAGARIRNRPDNTPGQHRWVERHWRSPFRDRCRTADRVRRPRSSAGTLPNEH